MGRKNNIAQQDRTLDWARTYLGEVLVLTEPLSIASLRQTYIKVLKSYFALAGLSRSKTAPKDMVQEAYSRVFGTRVRIERSIRAAVFQTLQKSNNDSSALFKGHFFGKSKKQGISVRAPLSTCNPTKLCAAGCYAHDVLDAAPNAMIRGVINGVIAEIYEFGSDGTRADIMLRLDSHIKDSVRWAKKESESVPENWAREPRIRFSHVGEIAAFPEFANALAREIATQSSGAVVSVIYTRHQNAKQLDPKLWVINFTLDKSSLSRKSWKPSTARLVFSAFGGEISADVDVNFLEHHRWSHLAPSGKGTVCPTTLPETQVRTCDAVRCKRCFEVPAMTNTD